MRRSMKARLAQIAPELLAAGSAAVARRLAACPAWQRAGLVLCFLSMPGEVDTAPIIAAAGQAGKSVAVPRIEAGAISFRLLQGRPGGASQRPLGHPRPRPCLARSPAVGR